MTSYIGQIKLFAFEFVPKGWLPCDGRLLNIDEYTPLFEYIGNAYGDRNTPRNQFRIPDLRGVAPIHRGKGEGLSNTYTMGKLAGSATNSMKPDNVPRHFHLNQEVFQFGAPCSTGPGDTPSPVNAYPAATPGKETYAAVMTGKSSLTELTSEDVSVNPAGAGLPFLLLQPSIGMNYCICIDGIFPIKPN
ncbi:phage tail protein [Flavobacterium pallidum]|uniref:Phage tail collar domain-containing protein n=1 Tax=Flavobacterium pallidum TaxID=2172098 RepID=A0A2S1SFS0_9FLAO|nr:tail fiber protein [Flavobacterium pallidum]AWI25254.1 hypothetical protein HYN49_04730 [Flavobacterium pallidum]